MNKGDIFKNKKILYGLLFLVIFSYFLWLNTNFNLSDPDAFYHAKIIELIKSQGVIKNFNWLPLTTLKENYIDHHLLYHLLVLPLTYFLPTLWAIKLAAAVFAAGFITLFQACLDKFKIKYSWAYTFILLTAYQFIFRLNLAKASALSLSWLVVLIYLIFNFKNKWSWKIFFLMWSYVWLYGGWIVAVGVVVIYGFVLTIFNWQQQFLQQQKTKLKYFFKNLFKLSPNKLLINALGGSLAGLIINPYFPTNLKFYWQQIIDIALINYKNIIDVGGEWYGISLDKLIQYNTLVAVLFLVALLLFFIYLPRQNKKNWSLLIISLIFLGLALKSQRNLEYFIPSSVLFSAFTINSFLKNKTDGKQIINKFRQQHPYIIYLLLIGFILYIPILVTANIKGVKKVLASNYRLDQFQATMEWLKQNSPTGTIVFHDRWDDWPVFFYYNTHNRYIIGLDPTFMYLKNPDLYQLWRQITQAKIDKPCKLIQKKFSANYVFVKKENSNLNNEIKIDKACQLVYDDGDGWLYKIKANN